MNRPSGSVRIARLSSIAATLALIVFRSKQVKRAFNLSKVWGVSSAARNTASEGDRLDMMM